MEQDTKLKASVIIRAYNAEATLARTVKSALAQDFPSNAYEIIIIDDGSTDSTAAVASPFSSQCRIIHQDNQGAARAANRGFAEAHGEYVSLLDADDELHPDFLQEVTSALDAEENAQAAFSDYEEEHAGMRRVVEAALPFQAIAGSTCYRYPALREAGFYREGIIFPEYELMLRMKDIWQFIYVPKTLYTYHRSTTSLSGSPGHAAKGMEELRVLHPDKIKDIQLIRSYTLT